MSLSQVFNQLYGAKTPIDSHNTLPLQACHNLNFGAVAQLKMHTMGGALGTDTENIVKASFLFVQPIELLQNPRLSLEC